MKTKICTSLHQFAICAIALSLLTGCSSRPNVSPEEAAALSSDPAAAAKAKPLSTEDQEYLDFRKRWEEVAAVVKKGGAAVEPYDETGRLTMRIIMPNEISEHDARKIAQTIRERLHEKAVVYVYDDTRKQRAKASQFGTE